MGIPQFPGTPDSVVSQTRGYPHAGGTTTEPLSATISIKLLVIIMTKKIVKIKKWN
jgi:hypothetical protein